MKNWLFVTILIALGGIQYSAGAAAAAADENDGAPQSTSRYNSLRRRTLSSAKEDNQLKKEDSAVTDEEEETAISGVAKQSPRGFVDMIHLVPFDVQIILTVDTGINIHEVNNIVTEWMNSAYQQQLEAFGYTEANRYAEFNSVVLFDNDPKLRRNLQGGGTLFTAKFKGGVVFSRSEVRTKSVPENDVLLIQQVTLLNDSSLTFLLQSAEENGLGSAVVDVNAFLNPITDDGQDSSKLSDTSLEIVIIVAILVACIAFLFLLGAVFWAYRYDRANREAYLAKDHTHAPSSAAPVSPDRTDSDTADESPEKARPPPPPILLNEEKASPHAYPKVILGGDPQDDYPESVISDSLVSGSVLSEDVSATLSQYYRAGMGKVGANYGRSGLLDDAGSVSSMESYGYSLDGGTATTPMPMPGEVFSMYDKEDKERIGGLPVEPDGLGGDNYDPMDDVQIPDLDKELAHLDIKLTPNMEHVDLDTYSQKDLEDYQKDYLNDQESLSQRSSVDGSSIATDTEEMEEDA